jgi:hypothetical protein
VVALASGDATPAQAMSRTPLDRRTGVDAVLIRRLRTLEGRRVGVAVRDGQRLDDCELVSAARGRASTVWLFTDGTDTFVPVADVIEVWEAA